MISFTRSFVLVGALAGTLAGCGTSDGLPGIVPYVQIESPSDNSTAKLAVDKQVAINFKTNYTLKAPGTCAGLSNCGHVYVLIDNTSCNVTQAAYNTLAVSSPTAADFSKCMTATGQHAVTLELHHDDGSAVQNVLNNPVTAKVTITTEP